MAPPTASLRSHRAGASSAAMTRPTSSPMANICRCGRSSRLSACRGLPPGAPHSKTGRGRPNTPSPGPGDLDFNDGPGPRNIVLPGFGLMGVQVCYEIIFSGQVVDPHQRPDFIFNPSNDAWFGRWGPPQHLAQARLRAAEEGIPVIRATPTGISAVVDADGRLLKSLPWRSAGRIDMTLPPARAPTIFARLGNFIPVMIGFLLLIAGIAVARGPPL